MDKNKNAGMIPRDRLNDEGRRDFPRTLEGKRCKREEYRKHKYGAIESQREVATELVQDIDRAITAHEYRRMWIIALISALASLAAAATAIIAVALG